MTKFNSDFIPKSALTIFAHPDDTEFSAAGTIAKWAAAGCEVTMVVCTSGNVGTHDSKKYTRASLARTRKKEQRASAKVLGAKRVVFLGHNDCELQPTLKLRKQLVREIRKHKPEVVICGSADGWLFSNVYINHPDHRAAGAAALEAVFPCAEMELLWPKLGKAHKVHAVYIRGSDGLDTWVDITQSVQSKIDALKCHVSQFDDWDPTERVEEWTSGEAKNARKNLRSTKNKNGKRPRIKRGTWKHAEAFRVMILKDDDS